MNQEVNVIDQYQGRQQQRQIRYMARRETDTVYTVKHFKFASVVPWKDWQTHLYIFLTTRLPRTVSNPTIEQEYMLYFCSQDNYCCYCYSLYHSKCMKCYQSVMKSQFHF
jgi:hypothetical protein